MLSVGLYLVDNVAYGLINDPFSVNDFVFVRCLYAVSDFAFVRCLYDVCML